MGSSKANRKLALANKSKPKPKSTSSRKATPSVAVGPLRVLPNAEDPSSVSFPFKGFEIVISLRDKANANQVEIGQFKQLIPELVKFFKGAARCPLNKFETAPTIFDSFLFTFSCVPLSLSIPGLQNASRQDIKTFSKIATHMSHYYEEATTKPPKRGRGRPRALSVDSVASDQSTESQARMALSATVTHITYKERDALKQIAPRLVGDFDEYPSYLLENVTIEVPPGLSPDEADYARNILHQLQGNRASGLKVTGLLSVDESQMASLVKYVDGEHPDLNKQYITLDNVLTFSIALDEVTGAPALWVLSETGHFEIRPHQEYRVVYSNMCKAIGLKYFIEDWYEDSEATQTWNSADDEILEILQEFTAFSIGTTDTQHQWVLRCREYKNFFLSQFDQDKIASVLKSSIYQWFKQGCPDLQPSLAIQPYGPEPDAPHFYPVADNSDDEEDDDDDGFELSESMNELFDQENDAQSEVIGNMTTGFKLDYISSEYPQGAPVGASIPVYLAVFICHMVESGRCPNPDTLTLDKIAYAMERDFSIHRYVTCKKLIRYFGQEIAAELPDEYRGYSFYKAMAAFPKELTVDDDKLKDMAKFDLAIIEFNKIVEGSKPFIRRSKTSIEAKKMKDNAAQNGLPIPPRSERNSRAKALVDFEFSTTFDQQQVPGSFNPDTEMKNGQSSSLAPLKPYHERYSAPKWPPELEHCVSPSMRQRWFDSLTPEQRSKHIQETIMRLYEEKLARDALKTPEQLAQEERTRRIKKARKSYDRRLGMRC